jgi:transcription elongation factor SPT6
MVAKEDLVNSLYLELVNRVNEVGVDMNKCVAFPHYASLLQFVCGLGPRKASYVLRVGICNSV